MHCLVILGVSLEELCPLGVWEGIWSVNGG